MLLVVRVSTVAKNLICFILFGSNGLVVRIYNYCYIGCSTFFDSVLWNHCSPSVGLFICLSFCPSVRLLLSFLKIASLFFSDIVYDDTWPWYLVTNKSRFLGNKFWRPEFGLNGPKSGPKLDFFSFSQVWFISFPLNCIQL